MFSLRQCAATAGMSSVRSRTVKPVKPAVCVESTAEGRMQVSAPAAERIGSATVSEHWPTQEMSWIVRIFGYVMVFPSFSQIKRLTLSVLQYTLNLVLLILPDKDFFI